MYRLLVLGLLTSAAFAQTYYSASLSGAQEVPPVVTTGRGWSVVRHDPATNDVRIFAYHENLSGAPFAAHLHIGALGVNGPIAVPLAATSPNTFIGTGTLTPAQAASLVANGTYVNVHTAANPGGEIRGQVVPSVSTRYTGALNAAQEVPPNGSTATGLAVAFLHEPENRIVYMVNSTGLVGVVAAHFHQGAAGVNGPIQIPLNGGGGNYCGVSSPLTAAQVAAWQANGVYVNVHTAANPGGEIRAQMLRDQGDHFVAAASAAQEVPPNGSPGLGGMSLIRGPGGTLTLQGQFAGLSSAPFAAHVHIAPAGVNGPIVFPLTIAGSTLSATFTPSAADLVNLRAGNWYVNVHTPANPGGEIRGQLNLAKLPTTFGSGCQGSNGVRPQIGATGFPAVGTGMSIDLYGALPGGISLFAFGGSRDGFAGLPLPLELPVAGLPAPGCFLLVEPATLLVAFNDAFGCSSQALNVPFNPTLRGASFYTQWFSLDALANPAGFVPSSALTLLVQ
ncbi:MAG: CHRD domain-containing protein [Planctomycetes bacterium]|nr:CHRD domain-containing protein [Planctomycetota bacterium]